MTPRSFPALPDPDGYTETDDRRLSVAVNAAAWQLHHNDRKPDGHGQVTLTDDELAVCERVADHVVAHLNAYDSVHAHPRIDRAVLYALTADATRYRIEVEREGDHLTHVPPSNIVLALTGNHPCCYDDTDDPEDGPWHLAEFHATITGPGPDPLVSEYDTCLRHLAPKLVPGANVELRSLVP